MLFRHDLRLADNRALHAAAQTGKPIVAAFVLDDGAPDARRLGGARRWWLHKSLRALEERLSKHRISLRFRRGEMARVTRELVRESGGDLVVWNRRYDPPGMAADRAMKSMLTEDGIQNDSFDGHLLHEPWRLTTAAGGPYKVYSPFWKALAAGPEPRDPLPAPTTLNAYAGAVASDELDAWKLLPTTPDWAGGLARTWTPGEAGASLRLNAFLAGALDGYADGRDVPGRETTSRLSPHLAHGEISPFQIWAATRALGHSTEDSLKFLKELAWREFSWHLLLHFPDLRSRNFNPAFDSFEWRTDEASLERWRRGRTGYPLVDAGMRQLWQTGWMHNRVRMVVASFLAKHLLIDWRQGEDWFWDTLVDADPANNPASWQWVAGSGADAAPYFRIFNPVLQGEKFDTAATYVRRWLPELAALPDRVIHRPWEATGVELSAAGVKLGETYPVAAVEHAFARDRALDAYKHARGAA